MLTSDTVLDDRSLFYLVKSGNANAFEVFYRRHFDRLYRSAFKRLRNTEACKDILQDVFVDCWARREQINNESPVTYLYKAVMFQVFKHMARSAKQALHEKINPMDATTFTAIDILYYKDLVLLVELWIETLPEKRREIFYLYYKESLSTRVIAQKLGIAQKTVQNQLGNAFSDLRNKLSGLVIFDGRL